MRVAGQSFTRPFPNLQCVYSYQNILVENPRPILYPCRVDIHRVVTQLAVDGVNTTRSDPEIISVAIVLTYT